MSEIQIISARNWAWKRWSVKERMSDLVSIYEWQSMVLFAVVNKDVTTEEVQRVDVLVKYLEEQDSQAQLQKQVGDTETWVNRFWLGKTQKNPKGPRCNRGYRLHISSKDGLWPQSLGYTEIVKRAFSDFDLFL